MTGKRGVSKRGKVSRYKKIIRVNMPTRLRGRIERSIGFRLDMSEFIRTSVKDYIEHRYTTIEEVTDRKTVSMTIRVTEEEYRDIFRYAGNLGTSATELIRSAILRSI